MDRTPIRGRIRLLCLAAILPVTCIPACSSRKPPETTPAATQWLQVVRLNTRAGIEIRPVLASEDSEKSEMFTDLIGRVHPHAAINGTFFSPEKIPQGDILIDGKLAVRGHYRNAIAMRNDGRVEIIRRQGDRFNWTGYKAAMSSGPRLIHRGKITLDPVSDGFRKAALTIVAARSGVGVTATGDLLLVVQRKPVKLADFAKTMLDLGAVEAMNLDGGPACGLYHDGQLLAVPALRMTNVLCVFIHEPVEQSRK